VPEQGYRSRLTDGTGIPGVKIVWPFIKKIAPAFRLVQFFF
jgi:hypothetical protein